MFEARQGRCSAWDWVGPGLEEMGEIDVAGAPAEPVRRAAKRILDGRSFERGVSKVCPPGGKLRLALRWEERGWEKIRGPREGPLFSFLSGGIERNAG